MQMSHNTNKNLFKNEKGLLTLDFIFASVLVYAFAGVLFVFAITFSAVEIAQYTTFASARAFFAAHKDEDQQKRLGEEKFDDLVRRDNAPLGTFFKNGWFELSNVNINDFNDEYNADTGDGHATFIGARTILQPLILDFNIPIFGPTGAKDLSANISSFLMREPTEAECMQFVQDRFERIQQLQPGFSNSSVQPGEYVVMADGGC